jgi:hypothetical protein
MSQTCQWLKMLLQLQLLLLLLASNPIGAR